MAQCVLQTVYWIISSFAIFGSVPAPFEVNESFVWKLLLTKSGQTSSSLINEPFVTSWFHVAWLLVTTFYICVRQDIFFFYVAWCLLETVLKSSFYTCFFSQSRRSWCLFSDNSKLLWGERGHSSHFLSMVTGWTSLAFSLKMLSNNTSFSQKEKSS